jgi:hypothetical protein
MTRDQRDQSSGANCRRRVAIDQLRRDEHTCPAPAFNPSTTNVIGRLPEGDSSFVHVLFLKDEITGSLGAVTFETADRITADNLDEYANTHINIVIVIE